VKLRPVGAELFHADEHDNTNSRFRNSANAPKKVAVLSESFCVIRIHKTRREVDCLVPTRRGERGAVKNYLGPGSPEGGSEPDYIAYVFVFLCMTITCQ